VVHAYNPSYSGGRGQEAQGLKPALASTSRDLILKKKKHHKNRAGGVAQGEGPVFKLQYCQNKNSFTSLNISVCLPI
jgi:hypothetical protein